MNYAKHVTQRRQNYHMTAPTKTISVITQNLDAIAALIVEQIV